MKTISKPLLPRFSENSLLPRILRFLHTALMTPNDSLKILSCPIPISSGPRQSFSNMYRLELWS